MKRTLFTRNRLVTAATRWYRRLPHVPGGGPRVALSAALFVATGLAQTLIVQSLLYSGGGDRRTLLLALPNYVGITLVAVVGGPAFRALDGLGVWCGTPRGGAAEKAGAGGGAPAAVAAGGGGGGGSGGGITVAGSGGSSGGVSGAPFSAASSSASAAAAAAAAASPSAARNRVHAVAYGTPPPPSLRGAPWYATALHPERRRLFLLAVNECGGFVAGISGIAIAGSGLYQVVFSGGTVVTAVLSVAFLKRRLSAAQWAAVGVITSGLLVTAAGQVRPAGGGKGGGVLTGICFVLVSCGFYSANYVIQEYLLSEAAAAGGGGGQYKPLPSDEGAVSDGVSPPSPRAGRAAPHPPLELPPPSGQDLSLYTGGTCLVVFSVYVLVHTVPHWGDWVTASIARQHGVTAVIGGQYAALTAASYAHAVAHYDLVATVGAVPIGVLNALRAVSVFAASALLFCATQASQCFNPRKGVATATVIVGAVGYSLAAAAASRPRPPPAASSTPGGVVPAATPATAATSRSPRPLLSISSSLSSRPAAAAAAATAAAAAKVAGTPATGGGANLPSRTPPVVQPSGSGYHSPALARPPTPPATSPVAAPSATHGALPPPAAAAAAAAGSSPASTSPASVVPGGRRSRPSPPQLSPSTSLPVAKRAPVVAPATPTPRTTTTTTTTTTITTTPAAAAAPATVAVAAAAPARGAPIDGRRRSRRGGGGGGGGGGGDRASVAAVAAAPAVAAAAAARRLLGRSVSVGGDGGGGGGGGWWPAVGGWPRGGGVLGVGAGGDRSPTLVAARHL